MSIRFHRLAWLALAGGLLIACNGATPPTASPTPTPRPTASPTAVPTPSPTATPAPSASPGAAIVTFQVGAERYRVLVVDPDQVAIAQALQAGEEAPTIPNGRIVRGDPGVNTGWSWHIDPDDFEFADVTIELCDGLPSYVEDGSLSGDRFCPWSARVVAIEPAP